ncbi:MAG: ABC transporter permease [candidate division Zixibacteria bacterium]|nr:ABC transporter permease [candidate division Zixibacteria bacterium]
MSHITRKARLSRLLSDYGMLPVLILLGGLFSVLTLKEQAVTGEEGAEQIVRHLEHMDASAGSLLVCASGTRDEQDFAASLSRLGEQRGWRVITATGDPSTIRASVAALDSSGQSIQHVATTSASRPVVEQILAQFDGFGGAPVHSPESRRWPTFLLADNLRNVANQITVIAIIAIGMTMVIITAGIDLSVGSLIALSAVVIAWVIGPLGGANVSTVGVIVAALAAMAACGGIGAFSGLMITAFRIPPFIATLAMMQVAAGLAYIISEGKPIYQLPDSFVWLGRGADPVFDVPVAVILMLALYAIAWVVMERSVLGRYIYAVGGNPEAARLAGIRVKGVLLFVYTLCGLLAGLGGIVMASQLKSGAPTYGLTYELYVIAAVVVGGTSLSGGEGKIIGTLIGALIIGVIQNGMNLTNIESYTQKVVLGLVILAAVLFDRLKQRGFKRGLGFLKSPV